MYEVSDEYKKAMKNPVQRFKLRGSVRGALFDENFILANSLSIVNQCSEENMVKIGSVYTAELKCTFLTDMDISRYAWMGADIELEEGLQLDSGQYEYVPLGKFVVAEVHYTAAGVEIVAYDYMTKFDKPFNLTDTSGTLYNMISYICQQCGVELFNSESDMASMANGQLVIGVYKDNDIETFRDYLSWAAQALCAFATIDRLGRLHIRPYIRVSVDTIDSFHRFQGASFAGYITCYSGVSLVNMEDQKTEYYGLTEDRYLTYNLGSNPLLQNGIRETYCTNILDSIQVIGYSPFSVEMIGSPAYDLGDVLTFTDGLADNKTIGCIMYYEYKYNSSYMIKGFGANPALATAKSKTDKELSGLRTNSSGDNELSIYNYTNTSVFRIGDGQEKKVCSLRFATVKAGNALFNAQILMDTVLSENSEEIVCKVTYKVAGAEVQGFYPTETWDEDGKHMLSLFYPLAVGENVLANFDIYLSVSGGSIKIELGEIKATLYGQTFATGNTWDGYLEFTESIPSVEVGTYSHLEVGLPNEKAYVSSIKVTKRDLVDTVGIIDINNNLEIGTIHDVFYANKYPLSNHAWAELMEDTWDNMNAHYTWN